jgi:hypothetical protein
VGAPAFYALAGAAALVAAYLVWLFVLRDICGVSPAKPVTAQATEEAQAQASGESAEEQRVAHVARRSDIEAGEDGLRRRAVD